MVMAVVVDMIMVHNVDDDDDADDVWQTVTGA